MLLLRGFMTTTLKEKSQLVVPPSIQRRAGIKAGDRLEFKVSGGVITISPKPSAADDEYTPAQRRVIDAELDAAEKGPFHGPFSTADEAIAHMKGQLKKRASTKKTKRH